MSQMILQIESLSKTYRGIRAVRKFSGSVNRESICSVIGPNGAGKTTLFNLITGKIKPDEGLVLFQGTNITNRPTHEICRKGMARAFQVTSIFPELSVFENIQVAVLARENLSKNLFRSAAVLVKDETLDILEMIGIVGWKDRKAGMLSHGDHKRLDIGIALARQPSMLLLDEPTAGMSPEESRSTTEFVRGLVRNRGLTVFLIEHDMGVVFSVSEKIMVMHQGELIATGSPDEIKNDTTVRRIYLGGEV